MILESAIRRGTRAAQPAANVVGTGVIYFVTDELVIERSNGTSWESYSNGAAGSITLAMLANLATQRVIGRNTAGTGVPEAVTAAQILAWIGNTQGQILYRDASGWTVLSPGTSGQALTTAGAGANPSWTTISSSIWPRKSWNSRATPELGEPMNDWFMGADGFTLATTQSNPTPDINGVVIRNTTSASANNTSGMRWHTGTITQELTSGFALPKCRFKIRTGSDITTLRFLIGLRIAAATPLADTENNMCLIRYSTNVPDTGWTAVTVDNVGNVNSSNIVAIAADTIYDMTIEYLSATEVRFTVNGTSVTITHASQIPTANITPHATVTTLAASARFFDWYNMSLDAL